MMLNLLGKNNIMGSTSGSDVCLFISGIGHSTVHVKNPGLPYASSYRAKLIHPHSQPLNRNLKCYNHHKQGHNREPAKEIQHDPEPSQHPLRLIPQLSLIEATVRVPVPPMVSAPARRDPTEMMPAVIVAAMGVIRV